MAAIRPFLPSWSFSTFFTASDCKEKRWKLTFAGQVISHCTLTIYRPKWKQSLKTWKTCVCTKMCMLSTGLSTSMLFSYDTHCVDASVSDGAGPGDWRSVQSFSLQTGQLRRDVIVVNCEGKKYTICWYYVKDIEDWHENKWPIPGGVTDCYHVHLSKESDTFKAVYLAISHLCQTLGTWHSSWQDNNVVWSLKHKNQGL